MVVASLCSDSLLKHSLRATFGRYISYPDRQLLILIYRLCSRWQIPLLLVAEDYDSGADFSKGTMISYDTFLKPVMFCRRIRAEYGKATTGTN